MSQKKANTKPITPITPPTLSISLVLMRPVEKAIALGGVEIGISMASDAQVATKITIASVPPKVAKEGLALSHADTAHRMGTSRAAVAELLMKLESR